MRRGKGGKARVAVFGDSTAKALWRWLQKRGREDGPLFLGVWGGRLSPNGLSELLARIKDKSGVQSAAHAAARLGAPLARRRKCATATS